MAQVMKDANTHHYIHAYVYDGLRVFTNCRHIFAHFCNYLVHIGTFEKIEWKNRKRIKENIEICVYVYINTYDVLYQ